MPRLLLPLTLLPLAACMATTESPVLDMANPASTYCASQGGETIIRDSAEGQVGLCRLPSGAVVDEWAFYRESLDA
jgi:putative hemolysin